jgi:hypothetical protein
MLHLILQLLLGLERQVPDNSRLASSLLILGAWFLLITEFFPRLAVLGLVGVGRMVLCGGCRLCLFAQEILEVESEAGNRVRIGLYCAENSRKNYR